MARLLYTVDNLVSEVRSLLDEQNQDSVDTAIDILPALNRAQDYAFDTYARKYPEPLLAHEPLTLVSGTSEYDMPEDTFEDRILKVEIQIGSEYTPVERISYRDISDYETSTTSSVPLYYCIVGRKLRFVGTPSGSYPARIWKLRAVEKLVLPQGRLTRISVGSRYVIVDATGSDLTTESDQLGSYVNVVDGQTGEIKATLQIANLQSNKVTFRSSPIRSSVLGRTVVGDLPATITEDDYLCAIDGICVPYFGQPMCNFIIRQAHAELSGLKLGGDMSAEEQAIDRFEKQVERAWVGREKSMRIQRRSRTWLGRRGWRM